MNTTQLSGVRIERTAEHIAKVLKVRRLKDIPKVVDDYMKSNNTIPYIVFDFSECGQPNAAGIRFNGNYVRLNDNAVIFFNKLMKVLKSNPSKDTLFVVSQECSDGSRRLFGHHHEVEVSDAHISMKESKFVEDVNSYYDSMAGYIKTSNGSIIPLWYHPSRVAVENIEHSKEEAIPYEAPKRFATEAPRRPFFDRVIAEAQKGAAPTIKVVPVEAPPIKGPVVVPNIVPPVEVVVPEVVTAFPIPETEKQENAHVVEEPQQVPVFIEEKPAVVVEKKAEDVIKEVEKILQNDTPKEVEKPAPIKTPAIISRPSFAPIAPKAVADMSIITWGGLRMVKFVNTRATADMVTKQNGADIFFFPDGTDRQAFFSLVIGGNYSFVVGDKTTAFNGTVLFKKDILDHRGANTVVKPRLTDHTPCNIPTTFVGSKLIK